MRHVASLLTWILIFLALGLIELRMRYYVDNHAPYMNDRKAIMSRFSDLDEHLSTVAEQLGVPRSEQGGRNAGPPSE